MKSFRVDKPCDVNALCIELTDKDIAIIVIRAEHVRPEETAMYAVIFTTDETDPSTVDAIIAAHSPKTFPSKTPTEIEMRQNLLKLETLTSFDQTPGSSELKKS